MYMYSRLHVHLLDLYIVGPILLSLTNVSVKFGVKIIKQRYFNFYMYTWRPTCTCTLQFTSQVYKKPEHYCSLVARVDQKYNIFHLFWASMHFTLQVCPCYMLVRSQYFNICIR